jgi:hypothetical protein
VHDAVQAVPGAAQITEAVVAAARCDPAPKLRAQATELVGRLRLLCAGAEVARNAISKLLPEKPTSFHCRQAQWMERSWPLHSQDPF